MGMDPAADRMLIMGQMLHCEQNLLQCHKKAVSGRADGFYTEWDDRRPGFGQIGPRFYGFVAGTGRRGRDGPCTGHVDGSMDGAHDRGDRGRPA